MKLQAICEDISAQQAKDMLFAYADTVAKTNFDKLIPALKKHFPGAVYKGRMSRAKDFNIDDGPPTPIVGKYSSWTKSRAGLEAAITDMYGDWADTLAIYEQDYEGIDVNAVLGEHDHSSEEEIIAKVSNKARLSSFIHNGESWPPDIKMLRADI